MPFPHRYCLSALSLTLSLVVLLCNQAIAADNQATAERIDSLVRQLNAPEAAKRDEAEQGLIKLAPTKNAEQCDAFLERLPKPTDKMPAEVRLRLQRLRKQIETELSTSALIATRVTLSAQSMSLEELFKTIHHQTGNQLADYREEYGQDTTLRPVTIEIKDETFFSAIDKILNATKMTVYPFSDEQSLAVVDRDEATLPRSDSACYAGPFRIEAVNVSARRNLRTSEQQLAHIKLEIAWEPRLQPIALSQSINSIDLRADDGSFIGLPEVPSLLNVEIPTGGQATELSIPFALPSRDVAKLSSLKGIMSALVPGRIVDFKFTELQDAKETNQSHGGVSVTLKDMRKNQDLWEVHTRIKVDSAETGLESYRAWVFQNLTYLLNKQGQIIDHAGFETTMQSETEVGLAYFFELPDDDLSGYTWVYRTPAAIVRLPIIYELNDIPLP